MTKPMLVAENLEKYFPPAFTGWGVMLQPFARHTVRALHAVSFAVAPGEIVAVIGANGAGKSTLLRILATLIVPTRGRAQVAGFDVVREPAGVRRQLGFHTGSDAAFYGRLSARENLEFFAAMNHLNRRDAAANIARVADLLGLGPVMARQVRALSTGIVHRLSLARTLLHAPAVLLLDEPTRSLDLLAAEEFRKFLKQDIVRRHGTTLVFSSHQLTEVEQLADRVAVLHSARLLAYDTLASLLASTAAATLEQAWKNLLARASRMESHDGR